MAKFRKIKISKKKQQRDHGEGCRCSRCRARFEALDRQRGRLDPYNWKRYLEE